MFLAATQGSPQPPACAKQGLVAAVCVPRVWCPSACSEDAEPPTRGGNLSWYEARLENIQLVRGIAWCTAHYFPCTDTALTPCTSLLLVLLTITTRACLKGSDICFFLISSEGSSTSSASLQHLPQYLVEYITWWQGVIVTNKKTRRIITWEHIKLRHFY